MEEINRGGVFRKSPTRQTITKKDRRAGGIRAILVKELTWTGKVQRQCIIRWTGKSCIRGTNVTGTYEGKFMGEERKPRSSNRAKEEIIGA